MSNEFWMQCETVWFKCYSENLTEDRLAISFITDTENQEERCILYLETSVLELGEKIQNT